MSGTTRLHFRLWQYNSTRHLVTRTSPEIGKRANPRSASYTNLKNNLILFSDRHGIMRLKSVWQDLHPIFGKLHRLCEHSTWLRKVQSVSTIPSIVTLWTLSTLGKVFETCKTCRLLVCGYRSITNPLRSMSVVIQWTPLTVVWTGAVHSWDGDPQRGYFHLHLGHYAQLRKANGMSFNLRNV